jgi:hypothetical protein
MQSEVHTPETLILEPSSFEFQIAVETLRRFKSPGTDQIPAEVIHVGGSTLLSEIHKLINYFSNKEELPQQWKQSIIPTI